MTRPTREALAQKPFGVSRDVRCTNRNPLGDSKKLRGRWKTRYGATETATPAAAPAKRASEVFLTASLFARMWLGFSAAVAIAPINNQSAEQ